MGNWWLLPYMSAGGLDTTTTNTAPRHPTFCTCMNRSASNSPAPKVMGKLR